MQPQIFAASYGISVQYHAPLSSFWQALVFHEEFLRASDDAVPHAKALDYLA